MITRPVLTVDQALRRAAVRATLAPSMRNLQPWRLRVGGSSLEVHADRTRRDLVRDRSGRQAVISCGCALFNARVSLAADGRPAVVDRYPEPGGPDYLARLSVDDDPVREGARPDPEIAHLDDVIEARRSSRPPFGDEPVAWAAVARLVSAAAGEGGRLLEVTTAEDRQLILGLARAEAPCVLVLATATDNPAAWLWAGEALEHVLLEVTRQGYACRPLTEFLEPVGARAVVSAHLGISAYPQALVLVGRAAPTPRSRRRRLVEVLSTPR